VIEELTVRTEKNTQSLASITERLQQLEDHEQLDRQRRAVEYLIQRNELGKITDELRLKEDESGTAEGEQRKISERHAAIKEEQARLRDLQSTDRALNLDKDRLEQKKNKAIHVRPRGVSGGGPAGEAREFGPPARRSRGQGRTTAKND
jgi:hypothetical protein